MIIMLCVISIVNAQQFQNAEEERIQKIERKLALAETTIPNLLEKVNINITNTTLPNFFRAISRIHKVNINVTNELNGISIVNGFNDVSIKDLIIFLSKEYLLDIEITGNIISIHKYNKPQELPKEKEISVLYDVPTKAITMDLNNDALHKVFRKVIDVTGRNIVYAPTLKDKALSLYVTRVPIDIALQKLAETNGLELELTPDGFYTFQQQENPNQSSRRLSGKSRRTSRLGYSVLDTVNGILEVNLKNTPISKFINEVGEDLNLNIFTASPLESAGTVTVKADRIQFDDLLTKIFESNTTSTSANNNSSNTVSSSRSNRNGQNTSSLTTGQGQHFTFKREGNVYYFGTGTQLTLKRIESVQMMHRSIAMLGDASFGGGNYGGNNFVTGGTNYVGSQQNGSNTQQRGGFNSSTNRNNQSSFSNANSFSRNSTTDAGSIIELFPETITQDLEIKIDVELNSFVVSGPSTKVEKFKQFVRYIDRPVPLVLIEVMILEVSRNATVETGVEFGLGEEERVTTGTTFPNANITLGAETINRIIGGFDGFGSLNLGNVLPNFYLNIKAMESNGNVKILSTPKLSTLNGHKAYLSSGQTTYYAVTSQNIIGSQNPQTSEITNFQPIDAELALEFKPYVAGDGQITLDIQVIQSSFSGVRIAENAPPDINSRRFSSILRMQSNDVAILGGIEEKVKNDSGSGVPILSRIPVLKWLFSKRTRQDSKRKLNVIIKPTVFY